VFRRQLAANLLHVRFALRTACLMYPCALSCLWAGGWHKAGAEADPWHLHARPYGWHTWAWAFDHRQTVGHCAFWVCLLACCSVQPGSGHQQLGGADDAARVPKAAQGAEPGLRHAAARAKDVRVRSEVQVQRQPSRNGDVAAVSRMHACRQAAFMRVHQTQSCRRCSRKASLDCDAYRAAPTHRKMQEDYQYTLGCDTLRGPKQSPVAK
jgi:hypothetical protein